VGGQWTGRRRREFERDIGEVMDRYDVVMIKNATFVKLGHKHFVMQSGDLVTYEPPTRDKLDALEITLWQELDDALARRDIERCHKIYERLQNLHVDLEALSKAHCEDCGKSLEDDVMRYCLNCGDVLCNTCFVDGGGYCYKCFIWVNHGHDDGLLF
jgi:hypothetical protein